MDYLVQREDKDFAAFQVCTGKKNALVDSAAGKVLHITMQELVQATAETVHRWYLKPHVWHPDFVASLRAVSLDGEWSAKDKLDASIAIWLRQHSRPFPLAEDCELRFCGGDVTVLMPLRLFYNAATDHLNADPRLPTRDFHPSVARSLKSNWARLIARLSETEGRKSA